MSDLSIINDSGLGIESKEVYNYQQLFTEDHIKTRNRMVDTSGEQWDIGESTSYLLNFDLIETSNMELLDQLKYVVAYLVKSKSPVHAYSVFRAVKVLLNSSESFDDESGEDLADALADEILYYFVNNRRQHDEGSLNLLRLWYQKGTKLKLPMFQKAVSDALGELKLKGNIKGLDILVHIKNKSPLNSNQLADIRQLLQKYAYKFMVGQTNYWRLVATWVFITLGIRPLQLRLLMTIDLAVNEDENTGRKTYILNVPSVKKRNETPRSRFRSRPIPAFLGEMLQALKDYNLQWIKENDFEISLKEIPLFMPTTGHHKRKSNSRNSVFNNIYSSVPITKAPFLLLKQLNKYQVDSGQRSFNQKVSPRRLRKTFATHAAACGTPAMLLMELLDHEDMQHIMVYYKLGANFSNKIDNVYRDQFGTILDYFKGTITLKELSEANKNEQVFGPTGLRRLVGIGFCGKDKLCRLAPPYSCYTCRKFEACNNKQLHEEVLDVMFEDVIHLFGDEAAPEKYEMDHIKACRSLISQLEVADER
ncbi:MULTISPECIES: tyrosine-type recombinase/integrase [unclassified Pseudoalteromonas]|uniref:tyrosine-type recombinase/integrase n=1 Tax=unclassified Pseudoalteromonas TaxID=194690 RepID=UPI000A9FC899|nr:MULTISPECIES: tyrosine-type recombinase/integrase [unclassified Pseudoalteromonas]